MFDINKRTAVKNGNIVTAAQLPMIGSGGIMNGAGSYANINVSAVSTYFQRSETLLRGIADEQEVAFRTFYRDIYRYDVVAGTAVEMMSYLPFSDFTIQGVDDKTKRVVFEKNIANLGLRTLFPKMSVDYYVSGRSVSSLLFNQEDNIFVDLMSVNPDVIDVQPSPLYNSEPRIKMRVDTELKAFLNSNDVYFRKLKARMPTAVLEGLRANNVVLDPLTTLFVPRQLTPRSTGTSIYRRLIPIYLLEKVLYRGTVSEAARRQRAIGHITAGSQYWEPQDADLQAILALFQQADLDPNGAMIATRNDVQYQDIRAGGDFWKWTEVTEQMTPLKMRALGISDALLSGEANISTQEASLSLFLEELRTYRDYATHRVFYERVFPLISVVNNYRTSNTRYEETANRIMDSLDDDDENRILFQQFAKDELLIPSIRWHKQLRPEADREYLDVLNTLAQRGVPIGLRAWAAAGGLDLDHAMAELEADMKFRQKIQQVTKLSPPQGEDGDDGSFEGSESEQAVAHIVNSMSESELRNAVSMALGNYKTPILARDFGPASEVTETTVTGKIKPVIHQARANKRFDARIATVLQRLSDPNHYEKTLQAAKANKDKL